MNHVEFNARVDHWCRRGLSRAEAEVAVTTEFGLSPREAKIFTRR